MTSINQLRHANNGIGSRDPGLDRPWLDPVSGSTYVTVNAIGDSEGENILVTNESLYLREVWIAMDNAVNKAARKPLSAWADLRAAATYSIDGFSHYTLDYEYVTDFGEANVSMDLRNENNNTDAPVFKVVSLPLHITSSSFEYSAREGAVQENSGLSIQTNRAEMAGQRVGEKIEDTLLFGLPELGFRSSNSTVYDHTQDVYGYTNHPLRMTKTDLTAAGTTPAHAAVAIAEILAMVESMRTNGFYGEFVLYHSPNWTPFLDTDYSVDSGITLRERLLKISGLSEIKRVERLSTDDTLILVSMDSTNVQAVDGMPIQTVMWNGPSGDSTNLRVQGIQVPKFNPRVSLDGTAKVGVLHATTS